jgi:DNA repair protein RecO
MGNFRMEIMTASKSSKLSGIVLKKTPCFEKDCMVELLTPKLGKKKLIAKYALSKSFRFGGLIEPTQVIDCELYQGKSMLILSQCKLRQTFPHLRSHFNALSIAFYFIGIIRNITQFYQPAPPLYHLLTTTLDSISDQTDLEHIKRGFHVKLLRHEGLLQEHRSLTDHEFTRLFYEYTGVKVKKPFLIG